MAYISSNDNRFYVGLEQAYGNIAATETLSRIAAVKLATRQRRDVAERRDKTGSRTFVGIPQKTRKLSTFELRTYMTDWSDKTGQPAYGPLFQACLGASPLRSAAATLVAATGSTALSFGNPHGLVPGQAVAYGTEIRFVTAVVDERSVQLNAPYSMQPAAGTTVSTAITYMPGNELTSVSILDYWSPGSAVQRVVRGAAMDELQIQVNGDFHTFQFSGQACDIVDTASFETGQGAAVFPAEPPIQDMSYTIVPGNLGQVWLGTTPDQVFSLTSATIKLSNNLQLRDREFGSNYSRGISPGARVVTMDLSIFQQDDEQTRTLYQAARQDSPVSVMLQLGEQSGQIAGIYLKGMLLETPDFDDSERRQQWIFKNCRAQGSVNDEISIAFA